MTGFKFHLTVLCHFFPMCFYPRVTCRFLNRLRLSTSTCKVLPLLIRPPWVATGWPGSTRCPMMLLMVCTPLLLSPGNTNRFSMDVTHLCPPTRVYSSCAFNIEEKSVSWIFEQKCTSVSYVVSNKSKVPIVLPDASDSWLGKFWGCA